MTLTWLFWRKSLLYQPVETPLFVPVISGSLQRAALLTGIHNQAGQTALFLLLVTAAGVTVAGAISALPLSNFDDTSNLDDCFAVVARWC